MYKFCLTLLTALFIFTEAFAASGEVDANLQLRQAIAEPEYLLHHWLELPVAPGAKTDKVRQLSLREAILLALRYNPNIQNVELDRIIQRYQLRQAYNEFEWQFALAGSAIVQNSHYSGVGDATTHSLLASPEVSIKNKLGGNLALSMTNNVGAYGGYQPIMNLSVSQPLLRGAGLAVNEAGLLDAIDNEQLNQLRLKQSIINQITKVMNAYRRLMLSGHDLENQRRQLNEARQSYDVNARKIKAGQLEPSANVQQSYQIESLSLTLEQAENEFRVAGQDLLQAIGLDPAMRVKVPSDVSIQSLNVPDLKQSKALALSNNLEYLALKQAYKSDQRALKIAENQQLWDLNLSANVQLGQQTDVDGRSGGLSDIYRGRNITSSAGISLTIPFRDLSRRSQLIKAKVQLEKDRINLVAAKRALETDVTNLIDTISSLAKRYRLAEKQVKLAEEAYRLQKKRQEAGISSSLDVTNTQDQLLRAQFGLISAKVAYLNQLASLDSLLGTTLNVWGIKLRL